MKKVIPLGFNIVDNRIYRSSYPAKKTFPYLDNLHLKSMVCLSPSDLKSDLLGYVAVAGINLLKYDIKHNQDPFLVMDEKSISEILDFCTNENNQPVLIFCTTGKVRTGCVVGCLRKRLGWSVSSIVQEFEQFTEPEGGMADLQFIDAFESPACHVNLPTARKPFMLNEARGLNC